jgi:hypothetical protein
MFIIHIIKYSLLYILTIVEPYRVQFFFSPDLNSATQKIGIPSWKKDRLMSALGLPTFDIRNKGHFKGLTS